MPHRERDPEAKVADLRSNTVVLVVPSLLLILVAATLGFVVFRLPLEWQRWIAVAAAAFLILVGFVLPLLKWLARQYTVTTRRTIIRDGLVRRTRREILHSKVVEVRLERHAGQLLAGTGDIVLVLGGLNGQTAQIAMTGQHSRTAQRGRADQHGQAVLRGIHNPKLVQAALTDLIEARRDEFARPDSGDHGLTR